MCLLTKKKERGELAWVWILPSSRVRLSCLLFISSLNCFILLSNTGAEGVGGGRNGEGCIVLEGVRGAACSAPVDCEGEEAVGLVADGVEDDAAAFARGA